MSDRNVDGINRAELSITRSKADAISVGLIDDGINRDGGFASCAVTDDEFALTTANGNHRIDSHDASLHRLVDRLTWRDTRSNFFYRVTLGGLNRTFTVDWIAERINDATEQAFANRNRKEAAGGLGFHAFFEAGDVAHDHATHGVFGEIEGDALQAAWKLNHFIHHNCREAVDGRYTVSEGNNCSDVGLASAGV